MSRPKDPRVGRTPIWQKVVLWMIGTGTVLVVGFGVILYVGLSGGWDDVLDVDKPTADDRRVLAAYDEGRVANREVMTDVLEVARGSGLAGERLGSAEASDCREGQHNWKIDDDFDLWCTLADTSFLTAGPVEGFADDMADLHTALVEAGWTGDRWELPQVVGEYWEPLDDEERAFRMYPANLPDARYTRGGDRLSLEWYVPGILAGPSPEHLEWTDVTGVPVSADVLVRRIPDAEYGMTLALERDYFKD